MFVNLSMGAIGVMRSSCNSLLSLLRELHIDKTITKRIRMKAVNISVRSSYINYKDFRRDNIWDKYFDENFFNEMSNETQFCHDKIFCI